MRFNIGSDLIKSDLMNCILKVKHKRKALLVEYLYISEKFVVAFIRKNASYATAEICEFWWNELAKEKSDFIFKKVGLIEAWLTHKEASFREWAKKIIEAREKDNSK